MERMFTERSNMKDKLNQLRINEIIKALRHKVPRVMIEKIVQDQDKLGWPENSKMIESLEELTDEELFTEMIRRLWLNRN
jgi:hypothetical protein